MQLFPNPVHTYTLPKMNLAGTPLDIPGEDSNISVVRKNMGNGFPKAILFNPGIKLSLFNVKTY